MAGQPSHATRLVDLVTQSRIELFNDEDGFGYAFMRFPDHCETWPIRSDGFRQWLSYQFFVLYAQAPHAQAVQDALNTLEGRARFNAPQQTVSTRATAHENRIVIDVGDGQWSVIEVDQDGWRVKANDTVRFLRPRGMRPLPIPTHPGRLDLLWQFLNVLDADVILIAAWLVAALWPRGPYPILVLQGEQGTAKSTVARMLRAVVDPSKAPLRSTPRDVRDLMIAARNGRLIVYDNLSGLPTWLSDALCRLATGGGFGTRALYTDTEEILIDVQRPVILNGIGYIATRQDLIDRSIIINLTPIPERARRTEAEMWAEFAKAHPCILAGLLDALSGAIRNYSQVDLPSKPRMADFAVLAVAAVQSLGFSNHAFLSRYLENRQNAVESGLEGSLVAEELRAFMYTQPEWMGNASTLLSLLNSQVNEHTRKLTYWPKAPNKLSGQLRKLATGLRTVGIELKFEDSGQRRICIRNMGNLPPVPPQAPENQRWRE